MKPQTDASYQPQIQAALEGLQRTLEHSGYDSAEVKAVVEGAREHVEELAANDPDLSEEELAERVAGFSEPEIAPTHQPTLSGPNVIGAFALASGVLGLLAIVGAFSLSDPDLGGALMLLGTILGGGLACALGFLSRRSQMGTVAMAVGVVLWLCLLAFLLLP